MNWRIFACWKQWKNLASSELEIVWINVITQEKREEFYRRIFYRYIAHIISFILSVVCPWNLIQLGFMHKRKSKQNAINMIWKLWCVMCFYRSQSSHFLSMYINYVIVSTWTIFIALWQQFEYLMCTYTFAFDFSIPMQAMRAHWAMKCT